MGKCSLAVGKTKTLTASGPADIVFKSSNKKVATVFSSGKVKAVKPGTATITAYSKSNPSNKATCKITVKYKLAYELNGGTNNADNPEWYTGTVKLKNPKSRKGYTFKGWYTDSKFKTKVTSVKNANKTLYAKWTVNSYKVKFDRNKGSGSMSTKTYKYGKEYQLPSNSFTRKGYTFTEWKDGSGKTYANKASVKNLTSTDGKTITLYAQWKAKTYTIDYKGLPEGAKNKNKTSYKITTATFKLDKASCPGYDFVGWYSDKKLTKKITSIAKGSTGNKTIYSKWKAHKYTIKFDANGGTGKMSSLTPCKYGKEYPLPKNSESIKMEGYVFGGWNTKSDGTGQSFGDGATVKNLVSEGSITLFAQWKPAFVPRFSLDGLDNYINIVQNNLQVEWPNCTVYAWARALEITNNNLKTKADGNPVFFVPGQSNAVNWWNNNLISGNPYPTGSKPKVGAIAVWSNGGAGHVAIVEHIDENGTVYYSHSNGGGFTWTPQSPYPGSINNYYFHCEAKDYWGTDLTLLGYIYLLN